MSTYAQTDIQFGPKAGANFSTMMGTNGAGPKLITAWHAGGVANFSFNKSFAVQPELVYSREGAEKEGTKYNLGYLRLPVLLQLRHASGLYVQAGPQLGLLMSAHYKMNGSDTKEDVKEFLNKFETSLVMGLGYRAPMGLGIDLRYAAGLSELNPQSDLKVHTLGVSISYLLKSK